MHAYLKKTLPWYSQWHDMWIHGPSHWFIFASAVIVLSTLFAYSVQHAQPRDVIEPLHAQVQSTDAEPQVPVVPDRVN